MRKKTHAEYEQELFDRELDVFPIEEYLGSSVPILHECVEGHTWKLSPSNALKGRGCPTCKGGILKKSYVEECPYEVLEPYVNAHTPILHRCPEGHEWRAAPTHILYSGTGCTVCKGRGGFKPDKPGRLYYVKISQDNLTYYKIGITNDTVAKRFRSETGKKIEVILDLFFENGREALVLETSLLNKYSKHRGFVSSFLRSGNSELFEFDVLEGDAIVLEKR
jgi:hypothetical protein